MMMDRRTRVGKDFEIGDIFIMDDDETIQRLEDKRQELNNAEYERYCKRRRKK